MAMDAPVGVPALEQIALRGGAMEGTTASTSCAGQGAVRESCDPTPVVPVTPQVATEVDLRAASQLLFKVANAVVCAMVYEVAHGRTPLLSIAPRTPQKQPLARPGRTPQTQTPLTWCSSAMEENDVDDDEYDKGNEYDAGDNNDDLDLTLKELDDVKNCLSLATPERSPNTEASCDGSPSQPEVDRRNCFENSSKGNATSRQRRTGPPPLPRSSAGSGPAFPREAKPLPPPLSGSLKALPQEHVQKFLRLVSDGDYADAHRILRKVRRVVKGRGCSKEAFGGMRALLHHLLEGYASAGRAHEAMELLSDMKKGTEGRLVNAAAFNAILRGLLARGSLCDARFVVREEMPRLGVSPNEASLNLLMDTAARAGPSHHDEAWDVLEEMQQRGLCADKYTVSILTKGISARGEKRRPARGVTLVEHFLKTQPDDVDEVLVNSLLDVFCGMGDLPRLEATLHKMREYGIRGSAVTYGTIVKAYGRAGNIEKVLQAWAEMRREGLEANAVTYGCMLDACVKCGHLDKALQVFNIMREQGLHKNTILYATLIKGFAKSKDPAAARGLHREMVAEGVFCNVVVFNSLIDACVRANDLHGAAEVLKQMMSDGVRPDLITFSTLIKGYCSNGELNKAMRLAEELQARELQCDEIVYNSLLEGCVKAGDLQLGLKLFTEMRQKSVRPSSVTFSILVKLLSRAGRLDLACHLVTREMREMHGVIPTRMVWSSLVTCCVKARDLARAVSMLDHLDCEGGAAGGARASMYATVVEGCLAQGELSTALSLCERVYGRAPPEEGARGLLSTDLLRRVFEAAGMRGSESEARSVLEAISSRLSDQVRTSLREILGRGMKRRCPRAGHERQCPSETLPHGSFTSTSGVLHPAGITGEVLGVGSAAATWPGGVVAAAQQWPTPSYSHGFQPSMLHSSLSSDGTSLGGLPGSWDQTTLSAAATNTWGWPAEGYDMYMYGPDACYNASWSWAQAWQDSAQWQIPPGRVSSTPAPGHSQVVTPSTEDRGENDKKKHFQTGAAPPVPPPIEAPDSPTWNTRGKGACVETPCASSIRKGFEETPATTAGSASQLQSPMEGDEEKDDDPHSMPLQMRLFVGEGNGCASNKDGNSLAALLEGPPGLC